MDVATFKSLIINQEIDYILDNVILANGAAHVDDSKINYITSKIASKYNVPKEDIKLYVVGSAKLGFSISEAIKGGIKYERYRAFSPISDVDIAVISNSIYEKIWNELSKYMFSQRRIPWDSLSLGDYLVGGWLRPDHFPKNKRLNRCDDWWEIFRRLSADQTLGRRQIRGGLFNNYQQLKNYQSRALKECISFEKNSL